MLCLNRIIITVQNSVTSLGVEAGKRTRVHKGPYGVTAVDSIVQVKLQGWQNRTRHVVHHLKNDTYKIAIVPNAPGCIVVKFLLSCISTCLAGFQV